MGAGPLALRWSYVHQGDNLEPRQWFPKEGNWFRCIQLSVALLLEEQSGVPVCEERGRTKHSLQFSAIRMSGFSGLLVYQRVQRGPIKEVLHELFGGSTVMTLTNGLEANGREGADQANLDLFSVSHSVCVLFLDFSWGQL